MKSPQELGLCGGSGERRGGIEEPGLAVERRRGGEPRRLGRGCTAGSWRLLPGQSGTLGLSGSDGLETRTDGLGRPRPGGGPSQIRSAIARRSHLVSSIGRPGEVHWTGAYSRLGTAVKSQDDRDVRRKRGILGIPPSTPGRPPALPRRERAAYCMGPSSAASLDSPWERGLALRCGLATIGDCRGAERPSVQRLAVAEGAGISGDGRRGPGPLRWRRGSPSRSSLPTPVALPSCQLRRKG